MSKSDIEFDRQHIWHPYTSMLNPLPAYKVESAKGCRLTLDTGHEVVDGMSSWWADTAIHA
jgi:adenosylmethionine-8-amino-7-oxononanoate aminotransferase